MKEKKYSIVGRTFLLLMVVILLQGLLSLNSIIFTNIATKVETYSFNTFTRTVDNRINNLESFMSAGWANIDDVSRDLTEQYHEILGDNDSLSENEKVEFLSDSVRSITQMITMTGTTGGFIILDDGEDMKYSYSTLYLKSYDNLTQGVAVENLMLARGPAEISKKNEFSLVSNWSYGVDLTENNLAILEIPMKASENTKTLQYLGYWHISTDITNDNLKVLTCSMPILDYKGNAIGVVGVEISQEYLYKFLPGNEFGDDASYGYFLAESDEKTITPRLINGTTQSELFTAGDTLNLETLSLEDHNLESEPYLLTINDVKICTYGKPLNLYANNSPYKSHEIWLTGMVELDSLTDFTQQFWRSISTMLTISLLAGIVISYFMGRRVAKPILALSKVVSNYDVQKKIAFPKSNLREIDELSRMIEQMQENILRSAGRTEKILELLDMGVGSFEYVKGSDTVTVSDAVYKILNIDPLEPVMKTEFFQKLDALKSNPTEEIDHTYGVDGGKFYKVEVFEQENVLLGVIQDTTKEVEDLLVLNYERNYDLLTGIYNRRAFHDKLMELFQVRDFKVAGFVLFDLDNLKYVNDTFGHDSGDVYIKTAATMIASSLQKHGLVARMSGDEFYAFLHGFDSKKSLMDCLDNLYAHLDAEPITMPNGSEFKIRVSGGIAWYGDDSTDIEELKKFADFAMYKGKHTLKGEMRQFDLKMYMEESFILNGKAELHRVLDNELVNFAFQPIIDVKSGELYAYEALMRPESEILASPLKLLQLATLEGKLWKVERITLFKTLSQYKKHLNLFKDAKMFLNSIPTEMLTEKELQEFKKEYQDYLPQVVMEITEQEQGDDDFILNKLDNFHGLGMDIALDDYGSGYANDIGLIKMKPNIVKIDRSLISNVHVDPSRQTIVQKIIAFCKEHGIIVLGEGIETEQELHYLINAGIDLAQGYYISRPMELPNFNNHDIQVKIQEISQP